MIEFRFLLMYVSDNKVSYYLKIQLSETYIRDVNIGGLELEQIGQN